MKKSLFLIVVTVSMFLSLVSAVEVSISDQTIQDDWTEDERTDNPVLFELDLDEGESFSNFVISDDNFVIFNEYNDETDTIELVPDIEEGTEAGTYTEDYTIETDQDEVTGTVGITVAEREEYDIDFRLEDEQINLDDSGSFGFIVVDNQGNFDAELNYNTNDSIIVNDEGSFVAERGEESERELFFRTDMDEELGEREFELEIENQTISTNYSIEDNINPEILNIDFDQTVQAKENARIDVEASDNTGIETVTARIIGEEEVESGNETVMEETVFEEQDLSEIDENLYSADLDLTETTGENTLEIEVTDVSGNSITELQDIFIEQLDVIRTEPSVDGGVAQTGEDSIVSAFEIEEDVRTEVTLDSYSYERGVGDSRVRLVFPDGSEQEFDSQGDTITVEEAGEYMFRINGNTDSDYSIRLSFSPVDFHVDVDDVVIEGDFVDLVIPDQTSRDWPGADRLECEVNNLDRNNLNESRYVCEIPFKLTELTSSDERLVPIAPSQQDRIENDLEDEIAALESELRSTNLKYYGVGGASVFMLLFFIAYIKIVPRYMFMLR